MCLVHRRYHLHLHLLYLHFLCHLCALLKSSLFISLDEIRALFVSRTLFN